MRDSYLPSIDELYDYERQVAHSLSGAQVYLRSRFQKLATSDTEMPMSGGWGQFLDDVHNDPSASGTSCALIALLACGESRNSETVSSGKRLLLDRARDDGGWSVTALMDCCSTTRLTCLALIALLDAGLHASSDPIHRGMKWLMGAQNRDGGWGETACDDRSDVTSTAYAMRVLANAMGTQTGTTRAIARAQSWILEVRNADSSWGAYKGTSGTLAHTSHAVEALLCTGMLVSALEPVQDWLTKHIDQDAQFLENYLLQVPGHAPQRLIWTHISRERALKALLRLGSDIAAPQVVDSVSKILGRQEGGSYWPSETFSPSAPAWALMEATTSLRLYLDHFVSEGAVTVVREEVFRLKREVEQQRDRIAQLEAQVAEATPRARLQRILRFMLRPIPLLVIVTAIVEVVYVVLRIRSRLPAFADTLAGILGIFGVALAIYQIIMALRAR